MLLRAPHPVHLTYCLNVHPGEAFADQWDAVRTHAARVRQRLGLDGQPFGLGLRLGARAVRDLAEPGIADAFARWCAEHSFYVFTINGFPYGSFHGQPVKAEVYRPDWSSDERLRYTLALADLLAAWLPDGVSGSISTVPVGYAADLASAPDRIERSVRHLTAAARHLDALRRRTGKDLCLALEPEPWCVLETGAQAVDFFTRHLVPGGVDALSADGVSARDAEEILHRHIGVCLDTCHAALAFESPAEQLALFAAAGIRVGKIQLSAALSAGPAEGDAAHRALDALCPFAEPVYFHQTAERRDGVMRRWADLPDALSAMQSGARIGDVRVHFHVPLQWAGDGVLGSTRGNMDYGFWREAARSGCPHLEIETYTYSVLPASLALADPADGIEQEYRWALAAIDAKKIDLPDGP